MNPLTVLELERHFICQTDECEVLHRDPLVIEQSIIGILF